MPDKETALLAIPEICADKIIMFYHISLFAGHQDIINTYLTISDKFFIPGLMHYLGSFLKVIIFASWLEMINHPQDSCKLEYT